MKIKISTMFTYDCDITEILRIVHLFFPAERKVQMLEGLLKVQKYMFKLSPSLHTAPIQSCIDTV